MCVWGGEQGNFVCVGGEGEAHQRYLCVCVWGVDWLAWSFCRRRLRGGKTLPHRAREILRMVQNALESRVSRPDIWYESTDV